MYSEVEVMLKVNMCHASRASRPLTECFSVAVSELTISKSSLSLISVLVSNVNNNPLTLVRVAVL